MSRNFSSTTSSSSSTSYSTSSSSSSSGGRTTGTHHTQQSFTNADGTTLKVTTQNHGEPVYEETRSYDPHGRELLSNASNGAGQPRIQDVEVEDVTDAEPSEDAAAKLYRERMEDEYAKREGGA